MKKAIQTLTVIGLFLILPMSGFTQSPPHPNGGSDPGTGNTPVGGGAPIGGGLIILTLMVVGYSAKKACTANWTEADNRA